MDQKKLVFILTVFCPFAFFLLFPSLDTIHKYSGNTGVIGYSLIAPVLLAVLVPLILPKLESRIVSEKRATLLFLLLLCVVICTFFVLYPIANSEIATAGSDQDDALDLAGRAMLESRYPFYELTYLGNLIAPMPGAVLLALPFIAIGYSAYQNLFWLAAFFFAARHHLKSGISSLCLILIVLVFSPSVMQNLVTGIDRVANTIYVLVFIQMTLAFAPRVNMLALTRYLPAVLLGVALSSRSNFLLLLPLVLSALVQIAGWRVALRFAAVIVASTVAVTVPFWAYDPQGFSPFVVQLSKIDTFETILPNAGAIVLLISSAVVAFLCFDRMGRDCTRLFRNCAIVEAVPVVLTVILMSWRAGAVDLTHAGYGIFSLFFGVLAYWPKITKRFAFMDAIETSTGSVETQPLTVSN